jgi:5-methylthioadenosine/S-adenosylhomocysteine deaminase
MTETSSLFDASPIMSEELVIINCTLLTDPYADLLSERWISIRNGRIDEIGTMDTACERSALEVLDADGKLVMPGLINGHNHCGMTLFRGMADDLHLDSWLFEHIFPAEAAHVDPDMVYWCTKLAAAEMILSGTTTVADCYFFSDQAARALSEAGMRAVTAHGVIDVPTPSVPDPANSIDSAARFIDSWLNRSSRVTPAIFAHAPYTCSPQTLREAKRLAQRCNLQFFIHCAETREEHANIIDPQGTTPVKHLAKLGILDPATTIVHAVWVDEDDLAILAECGTQVITCPQSNLKLASGIAPAQRMLEHNIRVGIGTDGCTSNNSLDLFREMDILAKIQKTVTASPTAMAARDVLACATTSGAAAIGSADSATIMPGARADLVIINTRSARLCPLYSQDLLVYAGSGSDVDTVIIDGRIIMQNRQICSFDLKEVFREVRRRKPAWLQKP